MNLERPVTNVHTLRASPREHTTNIDDSALELCIRVVNYTNKEIQVGLRNGIVYAITPKHPPAGTVPGVIVIADVDSEKTYVKIDSKNQLNDPINEDQKILKASIKRSTKLRNNYERASVEYFISREVLDMEGGLVYLPEVDIQVSMFTPTATPEHPFSFTGYETHTVFDNDFLSCQTLTGIAFKLVDNAGRLGLRYVNLNRHVYQLTPTTDVNLNDGLYVTTNGMCTGNRRHAVPKTQYYPTDKIAELFGPIYQTAEQARIDGDPETIRKREWDKAEAELKNDSLLLKSKILATEAELADMTRIRDLDKLELSRIQAELDRQKLASDQREQEFKMIERQHEHQRKMLENELHLKKLDRSDYYDERSSARKDSSDIVKMLPTIITGVVALLAFINSTKK